MSSHPKYKRHRVEYSVTSLEDTDTPGTLRYGVRRIKEPVYITFAVSGVLRLQSRLWIYRDYCTIDGESAPGPVIITGDTVYIRGNHITLRFVTCAANRLDKELDSVWALLSTSVLIEHCTIFGGSDEIVSATKCDNVVIRKCLIGNPMDKKHGFGCIMSGRDDHSINYAEDNVFVNCTGRTPNVGTGNVVISGNRVANYGHLLSYTTNVRDSVIFQVGNFYRAGPQTVRQNIFIFPSQPAGTTLLLEDNIVEDWPEATDNNVLATRNFSNGIFLEYNPENGRFKIVPYKDSYLSKKEHRYLYHRLDKLGRQLIMEQTKTKGTKVKESEVFEDGLIDVGNYKHRTEWDESMLSNARSPSVYEFPSERGTIFNI